MITPRHSRADNFTRWRPYHDKDSSETWQQVKKGRRPTRRESQSLKAQSLKKIKSRKAEQLSAESDPSSVSCGENEQNSRSSNSSELSILEQEMVEPLAQTPKRTVHSIVTELEKLARQQVASCKIYDAQRGKLEASLKNAKKIAADTAAETALYKALVGAKKCIRAFYELCPI
jgi:hypothetical protein